MYKNVKPLSNRCIKIGDLVLDKKKLVKHVMIVGNVFKNHIDCYWSDKNFTLDMNMFHKSDIIKLDKNDPYTNLIIYHTKNLN